MVFENGYEYITDNTIDSFLGKLRGEGHFIHESYDNYHGYIKVLGKNRPLLDCKIIDGRYNYAVEVVGMRIVLDALVTDDHAINGFGYAKGKKDMKVTGGAIKRIRLSDGYEEKVGTWQESK